MEVGVEWRGHIPFFLIFVDGSEIPPNHLGYRKTVEFVG